MAVAWQPTLLDLEAPSLDSSVPVTRTWLDERCWVDQGVGFLRSSGTLFDQLADSLPWRQKTRVVWEHEHLEPRLTSGGIPLPLPGVLEEARVLLSARYRVDFDACSANLYRNGRDSVAWHRDRVHRVLPDPIVVTLSLGHRRPFLVPSLRRRPVDPVRAGRRRPAGDGRLVPAPVGAHGAQGGGRRAPHLGDAAAPPLSGCDVAGYDSRRGRAMSR